LKALDIARIVKPDDDFIMLEIHINLADCYAKLDMEVEAEEAFDKCLQYYENYEKKSPVRSGSTLSRYTTNRPSVMRKIALSMRVRNEYEKAVYMLHKGIKIKLKIHKG
jgi:hypothetical protein